MSYGNPGDVYHIKGIADENHCHKDLEQRILLLEVKFRELRLEWDEFIALASSPPPASPPR